MRAGRGTEPVHDLRVASRRVSTALKLLDRAVPTGTPHARRDARRRRRWGRELKRVTKALGAARDTDVQADCVREFLSRASAGEPRLRPGVERLLLRLRQRRDEEQRKIVEELDRFERRGVLPEIRREFRALRAGAAARAGFAIPGRRAPARTAARQIRPGFSARCSRTSVSSPARSGGRSCTRCGSPPSGSGTRWRPSRRSSANGSTPWVRAARKIQTDLGDIHDCDVWILQTLPGFLAEERARARTHFGRPQPLAEFRPGIAALLRDRRKRRNAAAREFLRFWEKLRREKTWERLRKESAVRT